VAKIAAAREALMCPESVLEADESSNPQRADARTRTGDPFITRDSKALAGRLVLEPFSPVNAGDFGYSLWLSPGA
jgi:hypothetical protein